MIDGTYGVTMKIPFGSLAGVVTLAGDGEHCTASVEVAGVTQRARGTLRGDEFSFDGKADTPLGKMTYEVTGTANGELLSAVAKTKMGNIKVSGRRAS